MEAWAILTAPKRAKPSPAPGILKTYPRNRIYLKPVRTGTSAALYGNATIEDLTSIDVAPPDNQFSTAATEAVPGGANR